MGKCSRLLLAALGLTFSLGAQLAHAAETGVSDKEVVLGQSVGLTGPLVELAPDIINAAKAYFDQVNEKGGVHGRKIRTVVLDDGYQAANTQKTVRQLIDTEQAFALYSITGTANVAGILPMLAKENPPVPLFAPITGADSIRTPQMDNVFHIRASYGDEIEKMVQHLSTIGVKKIGVVWINNGMGTDGMAGIEKAMQKRSLKPHAAVSIQPDGSDADKAVAALQASQPEVIVMITTGTATVKFIKSYNKLSQGMRFYTLSVMGSQSTIRALGPDGVGVVVASVVPFPWSQSNTLAREYQATMRKAGFDNLSFLGFESYINARAMVEALKRAGKDLTRQKFISAVEGMKPLNLGGFEVNFSKESHVGSRFVELTIIGPNGKFIK